MIQVPSHAEFVEACRSYLGVPFKHRGRTRLGIDCAGLVICALSDLGSDARDLRIYGRTPHKDGLRQIVQENLGKPCGEGGHGLQVGDILLMKFHREPHHIGVVGDYIHGGFSLIHSYGDAGRVVEHRLDPVWLSRIVESYRLTQIKEDS